MLATSDKLILALVACCVSSCPLFGQSLYRSYLGGVEERHFGASVCGIGDVDGDSVGDYAIGAPYYSAFGSVTVYSGATGLALYEVPGLVNDEMLGAKVISVGDLDGDSVPDFVAASNEEFSLPAGIVRAYSGASGLIIHEWQETLFGDGGFGSYLTRCGDVNGDGVEDIAVCAPSFRESNLEGKLFVYSGLTGGILWSVQGHPQLTSVIGYRSVTRLGDLDGDGVSELALEVQTFGSSGVSNSFHLLSGASGTWLGEFSAPAGGRFTSVGSLDRDFDLDGVIDVVASGVDASGNKFVSLYSGDSLQFPLLERSFGSQGTVIQFLEARHDLTGDGTPDLLLLRSISLGSQALVCSGLDLHLVYQIGDVGHTGSTRVTAATAIEDVTGDGRADLLLGDVTDANFYHEGRAAVFTGIDEVGIPYCTNAVPNSTGEAATLSVTGSDFAARNWISLEVRNLPPANFGFFLTSQTTGFVFQPGGSLGNLCLGGEIGRFNKFNQIRAWGAEGATALGIDLLSHPQPTGPVHVMAGEQWSFQMWYRDFGGNSNFSTATAVSFQ